MARVRGLQVTLQRGPRCSLVRMPVMEWGPGVQGMAG